MWILDELKNRMHSDQTAMIHRDRSITYRELWTASEHLAAKLEGELKTMAPVVIYGNKDIEILVVMMAALKTGRPYVPVDVTFPVERLQKIADMTETELLFNFSGTDDATIGNGTTFRVSGGDFHDWLKTPGGRSDEERWVSGGDDCYILFTSGSTGEPKGVQITKDNIINFTENFGRYLSVPEGSRALNQVSYSFDVSDIQLYYHLANGVSLFNIDREMIGDFGELFSFLGGSGISSWVSTPSFIEMCAVYDDFSRELLPDLERIVLAGEVLTKNLVKTLWKNFPGVKIVNGYGPSEITVLTSACEITREMVQRDEALPIGHVLEDGEWWIESKGEPVEEDGKQGELIVASRSVSPGYYKQQELTEKAFGKRGALRYFRTHDLVYRERDLLYFCGRIDFQVKLNGYRIELEDVEKNLNKISCVENSAVIPVYKNSRVDYITGFVVMSEDLGLSRAKTNIHIKKELKELVPSYMIPKKIVVLDSFPVNTNGKIDRKKLADEYLN